MGNRRKFTAWLPSTPCTPEMRAQIMGVAEEKKQSISELTREALSLFLSQNDCKSVKKSRKTVKKETQNV